MFKRKKGFPEAAAEITHTAAERSQEIVDDVVAKIAPLLEQAQDALTPIAKDAKKKSAHFAANVVDKAQPGIEGALDKVAPAIESVKKEMVPKVQKFLHNAAELPIIEELPLSKKELKKFQKEAKKAAKKAKKDGGKAFAKITDNLPVVTEKKRKKNPAKIIAIIAGVSAVLAAASIALRQYLKSADESGWAAHEPSSAYTADVESMVDEGAPITDADIVADAHVADDASTVGLHDEGTMSDDIAAANNISTDGGDKDPFRYGENSFIGDNPPEGYTIKGNERSMKYHVEGNEGYERTITDVWFNSPEAAEAAGFTRAQR